jgi:pimeloyl-ACP methyl ester carboxylesterase
MPLLADQNGRIGSILIRRTNRDQPGERIMITRRTFVTRTTAAALATPAIISSAFVVPSAMRASDGRAQTFVVVHGAWTGGWIWRPVSDRIAGAGHRIFTPTLTGLGERVHLARPDIILSTHIDDVVNVILFEDLHDVVLVGHSYAGMVITGVAERVPERLSQIVYLDAYVPRDGQALVDLLPAALVEALEAQADAVGDGWRLPHDPPDADRRTDFPVAPAFEPLAVRNPAAAELPHSYIACVERVDHPLYLPFQDAAARAVEEGWTYRELPTGHHAMETMPAELSDLLIEIATA